MSKKNAAVYLMAARMIEEKEDEYPYGCCYAIAVNEIARCRKYGRATLDDYTTPLQNRFNAIFNPGVKPGEYWWEEDAERGARIVALCFAAVMAEAGDL